MELQIYTYDISLNLKPNFTIDWHNFTKQSFKPHRFNIMHWLQFTAVYIQKAIQLTGKRLDIILRPKSIFVGDRALFQLRMV